VRPLKLTVRAFGPYAGEQVFDFAALDGRSFFLIHGPTGAGKTSILDAICFALYGQASGARDVRQMRSDHATPERLTEVEYDFSIGPDHYRVHRRPEQERPKKRGTGTMTEKPVATIWKRGANGNGNGEAHEEDYTVLDDGWARVNERIERLLGFKVDQFRQVVMLPQGMFQRLLLANSKEREEILEALFAVEAYGRIEAALKEAALSMKREREQATQRHAETLRNAQVESRPQLDQRRIETQTQLEAGQAEVIVLRSAKKSAQEALEAGRAIADKIAEAERAKADVTKLESQREAIALKQKQHEQACKALVLVEAEENVLQRKREAEQAAAKLEAAKKTAEMASEGKSKSDTALGAENAREPLREEARRRQTRLDTLVDRVRELAGAAEAVKAARARATAAQGDRAEADKSVATAKSAIETAEKRRAELDALYAQKDAINERHTRTRIELNTRTKLEEQQKLRTGAVARLEHLRRDIAKSDQTLNWSRQTFDDMQARWSRGQATLLARSLSDGQPCPVCGSLDHPRPARSDEDLPSEAKLRQARDHVAQQAKDHAQLQADLARHQGELNGIESQIAQLEEGLGLRIGHDVESLERELKDFEARLRQAEDAGVELDRAQRSVKNARSQESLATSRLAQADQAATAAHAALSAAEAILTERQSAVPEELRASGALDRERETIARRRKALDDALASARKSADEASTSWTRAQSDLDNAAKLAETSNTLYDTLRREFGDKARQAGFDDHAAFKAARLGNDEIRAIDARIRDYHVAVGAAKARLERARAATVDLTSPDLAALAATDAAAQQALEAKINLLAQLTERLTSFDACIARLTELESALADLDARYAVVGAIADAANGQNAQRITFQRYVLGVFLDEVLYAATQRLRTMSKGRFLLQRSKELAGGNRAGGLDLEVHDTHTSTVRPVSTLSGGESFLASLSLALGLADVVQSYAGGIRLETIFVDEGFGTLDPESLDLAIRALRDLQKGGRLVGIISHVTELREWIDARLEVTTGRSGSVAQFVLG
jgi:exonuclease SbcC